MASPTIMVSEVYDALVEAGASDEKARRAAEAIAGYDLQVNRTSAELTLHRWLFGVVIALEFALIGMVFQVLNRVHS